MFTGMLAGIALVTAFAAVYVVAASMGVPRPQDGLKHLGGWVVAMVATALAHSLRAVEPAPPKVPEEVRGALWVVGLTCFVAAVVRAQQTFRTQHKALVAKLPPPPKTSSKRIVARGAGRSP